MKGLYLSDFQIQPCCPGQYLSNGGILGHPSHNPFVLRVCEKLVVPMMMVEKFFDGGSRGRLCCMGGGHF